MQDFEFTIQEGKLYMCKPAMASAPAPRRTDRGRHGGRGMIRSRKRSCVCPNRSINCCTRYSIQTLKDLVKADYGHSASPGAAVGRVAFTLKTRSKWARRPRAVGAKGNTPDVSTVWTWRAAF